MVYDITIMRRVLRTVVLALISILVFAVAAFVWVYTRPVFVSPNTPCHDNARLSEELLASRKALFIGAHPDDIEFYCGALVYMLRQRGAEVVFAVGTRGGKGRNGARKERIERLRSEDQLDAAKILGEVNVVLYDYPDKGLGRFIEPFAADLKRLIEKERPDVIFAWEPEQIYNPHPDHVAAAQASRIATKGRRVCYYGTRDPNLWIGFGEDEYWVNIKALRAHRTETPWYYYVFMRRVFRSRLVSEGKKLGTTYAEVFRCSEP